MQKLVPITRLGKFFGAEDYSLDIGMGEEWLLGDMNFTIVLYRVDRYKTKTDDVYGEVTEDGIQFLAPIELQGLVQVMAPAHKLLGNSKVEQQEPGNMKFSLYQKQLDDLYNAIVPLLNNLKKNPQKEYILWPNRLKKVEEFETHLQKIYKGE